MLSWPQFMSSAMTDHFLCFRHASRRRLLVFASEGIYLSRTSPRQPPHIIIFFTAMFFFFSLSNENNDNCARHVQTFATVDDAPNKSKNKRSVIRMEEWRLSATLTVSFVRRRWALRRFYPSWGSPAIGPRQDGSAPGRGFYETL